MSVIGNFNGSPIIATPGSPGFREVQWSAMDIAAIANSPFTGQQQIQNWKASFLSATVTMPPMKRNQANAWIAFLLECQGPTAAFYIGDSQGAEPQGTALGTPVTAGSNQAGYALTSSGWNPNQTELLLPGDYLQIGLRLFRCLDTASSDSNGNATFAIWPQVREPIPNGTTIITDSAQGLFRLATSQRQWSESYLTTYGLSFPIREAL
jgi:hypothetical protein